MPQSFNFIQSTAINASPGAAAETNICTFTGVTTNGAGDMVLLSGLADITIGTAGVLVTARVRRGNLTGTLLNTWTGITVVAGNTYLIPIEWADTPGEVVNQQYAFTIQVGSATAATTINQVQFQAVW